MGKALVTKPSYWRVKHPPQQATDAPCPKCNGTRGEDRDTYFVPCSLCKGNWRCRAGGQVVTPATWRVEAKHGLLYYCGSCEYTGRDRLYWIVVSEGDAAKHGGTCDGCGRSAK